MSLTGSRDAPPIRGGRGALGDSSAAWFTALGGDGGTAFIAPSAVGQMVDVSNMDAIFSLLDNWPTVYGVTGSCRTEPATAIRLRRRTTVSRPKDGWVVIGVGNSALFRALVTAMGQPELGRDPGQGAARPLERHDESTAWSPTG